MQTAQGDGGTAGRRSLGVVIAAHQAAAFLDQTLASVVAQLRAPERVVVVDDASTDGTADVARRWADRLPLTVLRLDDNVGAGVARAAGIATLDTDLVALLDADDYWFPDHLAHLEAVQARAGGMTCPLSFDWWPGRRMVPHKWRVPREGQLESLTERCWVFSGGLFARSDYDAAGGFRDRPYVEDWDLWLRMAVKGVHFSEGTVPTVLYRRWSGNATDRRTATLEASYALVREHHEQGLGLPPEAVQRSLRSIEAEMALQRTADLFAEGRPWRARAELRGALRGRPKLKVGALAVLVAPRDVAARLARRGYADPPTS